MTQCLKIRSTIHSDQDQFLSTLYGAPHGTLESVVEVPRPSEARLAPIAW